MKKRINDFKKQLNKRKLDALLITSLQNIAYLTGFSDFYGPEREAFLFLTRGNQFILTDGRYSESVRKLVQNFELLEISYDNPIEKIFKDLVRKLKIKKVGVEEKDLTFAEHKRISKHFNLIGLDLSDKRSIKDAKEIELIGRACKLGDKTFSYILDKIKQGITEKQIAFDIEFFIKKNGGEVSFPPLIAFGENAAIPHHKSGETKIDQKNGQFVLLDFGTKVDGYCSDMTRTVFFGKASQKQKKIYNTVYEAQQRAIAFIARELERKGFTEAASADKVARESIIKKGYATIPHSLGHGIGLEVHEHPRLSPKSKDKLKSGMVFSIEPGIYIPGFGGVRIEDLFVIEENKIRQLTNSSKALIEI